MRLYLDTNVQIHLLRDTGMLSKDNLAIVSDYSNTLLTSSVCVHELVHLIQIGKIRIGGCKDVRAAARAALQCLEDTGVDIVPVSSRHVETLIDLPLYDDHRDPNDRMIVAQAISDKAPLISSDRKFARYERYGLDFIYNDR